ncbi:hypothetical protein F5Y03DRAFT_404148 [Xylaria venustula]|nr:hypothetical protein F5Y03DRAFT_404148 [Xylaria venustula]
MGLDYRPWHNTSRVPLPPVYDPNIRFSDTDAVECMGDEYLRLVNEKDAYKAFITMDNLLNFTAYVYGPDCSVYRHKLFEFQFAIPEDYPKIPPNVRFVQNKVFDSLPLRFTIHPCFLTDGIVDLILLTIRCHLDKWPHRQIRSIHYENNNNDFNRYVEYLTWWSSLIQNISYERNNQIRLFLRQFIETRRGSILHDLSLQERSNMGIDGFYSPYRNTRLNKDYEGLMGHLYDAMHRIMDPDVPLVLNPAGDDDEQSSSSTDSS